MIYEKLKSAERPALAVLVDPDRHTPRTLSLLVQSAVVCHVDFFFVGGSLLRENRLEETLHLIKSECDIPAILFPGNNLQVSSKADALLMLSLISGRNAEYLIGQHVNAAPYIKEAGLETIATGYLLIDGGRTSTTAYMTQTLPIPHDKADVAVATALAGEMLGMKLIYLEAGSGALRPVEAAMIRAVRKAVHLPLIVGGGIREAEQAEAACRAGADVIVVGNLLEQDPGKMMELALAVHQTPKVKQ